MKLVHYLFILIVGISCSPEFVKKREAREDVLEFEQAKRTQRSIRHRITADVETNPVITDSKDQDAADDPAIWYNRLDPEKSIVFGSNKVAGIHAYNLEGHELQFVRCGKINNIDIRQNVSIANERGDILAGSNRSRKSIDFFRLSEHGNLEEKPFYSIPLHMQPYGFCLGMYEGSLAAFVNDKKGHVAMYVLTNTLNENTHIRLHQFKLKTQVEGMVFDDAEQILYVGEEQKGIFYFDLKEAKIDATLIAESQACNNPFIRYDIEGLSLFSSGNTKYLVASIQGNFSYALFDLNTKSYTTSFIIESDQSIDAVEETDGLEILPFPMGKAYPHGLFVVQDGFNYEQSQLERQNFKYIALEKIISIAD